MAKNKVDKIKRKTSPTSSKSMTPIFQMKVANDQLEKLLATATLKFGFGNRPFAEHFVVIKSLTVPIIGLHFNRHNSVVIDTTYGLIHFPL